MGLGEVDRLTPGQEGHLSLRHPGRLDGGARIGRQLLLLDGDLEHASERAVVAVDRAGGEAGVELVVQPVLDLLGREPPEAIRAEPGQHVALEVAPIGLLRAGREPAGKGEEVLGPVRERDVSAPRVDPLPSGLVGLDLQQEALGICLPVERLDQLATQRIAVARPVAPHPLLDVPNV